MSFNITAFIIGFLILAAGGACVIFYQKIGDNLASGVHSYDRVKLFGVIAIAIGFLVMTNLYSVILNAFVSLILPGK